MKEKFIFKTTTKYKVINVKTHLSAYPEYRIDGIENPKSYLEIPEKTVKKRIRGESGFKGQAPTKYKLQIGDVLQIHALVYHVERSRKDDKMYEVVLAKIITCSDPKYVENKSKGESDLDDLYYFWVIYADSKKIEELTIQPINTQIEIKEGHITFATIEMKSEDHLNIISSEFQKGGK